MYLETLKYQNITGIFYMVRNYDEINCFISFKYEIFYIMIGDREWRALELSR
jgi:hypothetical protein